MPPRIVQTGLKVLRAAPYIAPMKANSEPSVAPRSVDLNTAGMEELVATLPGIGPALAERIIAFRQERGPFASPSDLALVPGIGARRAERLSSRVSALATHPPEASSSGAHADDARAGVFVFDSEPKLRPDPFASEATPPSVEPARAEAAEPVGELPEEQSPEPVEAVAAPHPGASARRWKQHVVTSVMVALGLIGGAVGAVQSERKAVGTAREDVRSLRVDESAMRAEVSRQAAELARQAADLATTRQALAAAVDAQAAAAATAEARSDRIARDVADLADKTRRAQARTDTRVYRLDEAVKLIDWATTGGLARSDSALAATR